MSKTIQEQIEVMIHFMNGKSIEAIARKFQHSNWVKAPFPCWDWDTYDYRIKEEKKTVTIEKWLVFIEEDNEYKILETSNINPYNQSIYKQIKLLETYEVEL